MIDLEIKKLRKQLGKSLTSFGVELGVSNQTVSNWEKGKRTPNTDMLNKIRGLAERNNCKFSIDCNIEEQLIECTECGYKNIEPSFSYCPKCGNELFEINYYECEKIILNYYQIDKLIAREELKTQNPFIDLESNRKGVSQPSNNKEESKAIKYSLSTDNLNELKKIKKKVPLVINFLPGIEKEIIELLYCSYDNLKKSYHSVSKITGIDYIFIKETDKKVIKMIANYFRY